MLKRIHSKSLFCEKIYIAALSIAMFCAIVQSSVIPVDFNREAIQVMLKIMRYLSYAGAMCCILLKPFYHRSTLIMITIVLFVAIAKIYFADARRTALIVLFIIAFIGEDYRRIAKAQFIIMTGLYALICLGSQIGLIRNWGFGLDSERPRYCLGFFYPSHTTSLFFFIVLLFCYLKGRKLNVWHIGIIAVLDWWQYRFTDSRAGSVLAIVACVFMYGIRYLPDAFKLERSRFLRYIALLCAILCIICTISFQEKSFDLNWLDRALSGRLTLQAEAMENYGIRAFGQSIEWIGKGGTGYIHDKPSGKENYLDSSFMRELVEGGAISFIIWIAGFVGASIYASRIGDRYLLLSLAFVSVYSTVEQWMFNIGYDPFLVLIGVGLMPKLGIGDQRIEFPALAKKTKPDVNGGGIAI